MKPDTAVCYIFASSSSEKTYQTLLYVDGSTSCDCPGWTRRPERICKHTRLVAAGLAEREALKVIRYAELRRAGMTLLTARAPRIETDITKYIDPQYGAIRDTARIDPRRPKRKRKPAPAPEPLTRKFDFDA